MPVSRNASTGAVASLAPPLRAAATLNPRSSWKW